VNERLGQVSGWQEEASPVLADWARIMDTWEVDKRTWQFTEEFYRIELPWRTLRRAGSFPAAGNGGIDNGQLLVASESIVSGVFEPLVSDILEKLDKVLASLVHGPGPGQVILVGGFGGCFYLRDRLQRHLADRAPGVPLTILDDDLPGEAIVRGAAHFALTPDVISSRTMQHTYGCEMAADCRRPGDRHPELHERVRATRWSGEREACRQVRKLATRGQVIEPGTLSDVITLLPADFRQRTVVFTLYRSDEPDPYFTDRCQVVGSAELGVRSPWWRTGRQRRAEVQVTFGGSELLVQRVDRRSHEEIRLSYSREAPHDRA
jgi:hypothetical protein